MSRYIYMLMIQAVANTMIMLVFIAGGVVVMKKVLRMVVENQFAKIAQAEAIHLDEKYRELLD